MLNLMNLLSFYLMLRISLYGKELLIDTCFRGNSYHFFLVHQYMVLLIFFSVHGHGCPTMLTCGDTKLGVVKMFERGWEWLSECSISV